MKEENFASFFDSKINNLLDEVEISNDVYNGTQKVQPETKMFKLRKGHSDFIKN